MADKALYVVKQHGKHGYNIYSRTQQLNEMEISDATNLSNIEIILEERNRKEEAFVLGLENFRAIYRFLRRATRDGRLSDCILLISIALNEDSEAPVSEVGESFLEALKSTLRRSDTITQSSNNQFVVILYDLRYENVHLVVDRIKRNWQQSKFCNEVSITYEYDVIKS